METEISSDVTPAYGSSIEALHNLRSSNNITKIATSLSVLQNGIEYSFVEVTCSDGIEYGLQAYGNEALALNKAAHKIIQEQELPII